MDRFQNYSLTELVGTLFIFRGYQMALTRLLFQTINVKSHTMAMIITSATQIKIKRYITLNRPRLFTMQFPV